MLRMGTIKLTKMEYVTVFHRLAFKHHHINSLISISLLVLICLPWSTCVGEKTVIKLEPPEIEYVVHPGDGLTVKCYGDKRVTWIMPERVTNVEVFYNDSLNFNASPDSPYVHEAVLELINITANSVGFYSCKYHMDDDEAIMTQNSTFIDEFEETDDGPNFYLYVDDPEQILVEDENNMLFIEGRENMPVILPCRPTSPDVKMQLFKYEDEEVRIDNSQGFYSSTNITYDSRYGFRIPAVMQSVYAASGMYACKYKKKDKIFTNFTFDPHIGITIDPYLSRHVKDKHLECKATHPNGQTNQQMFILYISSNNTKIPKPSITDHHGTCQSHSCQELKVLAGTDLQMNCTLPFRGAVSLSWSYPQEHVNESRLTVKPTKIEINRDGRIAISYIVIKNISKVDEGNYICKYFDQSKNKEENVMSVKVFEPSETYIHLSEPSEKYEFQKRAGRNFVVRIDIDAYPKVDVVWYDNHDNEIRSGMGKYDIKFDSEKTKLTISDLQLSDAGKYKVRGVNKFKIEATQSITLKVEDYPIPTLDMQDYYLNNDSAEISCSVTGYPLPKVIWHFLPNVCTANPCTEEIPAEKFIKSNESHVTSSIIMLTTESGNITCTGVNNLSTQRVAKQFLIAEVEHGFGIVTDNELIALGDTIVLTCIASVYTYKDNVAWYNKDKELIENEDDEGITVDRVNTTFSYKVSLTIPKVVKSQGGLYYCSAENKENNMSVTRNITVDVHDLQEPLITVTNFNGSIEKYPEHDVELYCCAEGIPKPDITWYKQDEYIPMAKVSLQKNCSYLTIVNFSEIDEGSYKCRAENRVAFQEYTVEVHLKNNATLNTTYVIVIIVVLIAFFVFIIYLLWRIRKERNWRKELSKAGLLNFQEGATHCLNPDLAVDEQAELLPYDPKWEFPFDKLSLGKQLGSGAFGVVFKAEAHGILTAGENATVAVKMVKKTADNTYIKALASELKIMVHLGKHLNVVNLLGACTKNVAKRELLVIVEYCQFGNLRDYLLKHREVFIDQIGCKDKPVEDGFSRINRAFSSSSAYNGTGGPPAGNDYIDSVHSALTTHTLLDSASTGKTRQDSVSDGYTTEQPRWRSNYRSDFSYDGRQMRPITTRDLLCWSFQIARGMDYLARRKVLHGDLAARNILLADDNVVKICDFGLARSMYKADNYKKEGDGPLPVKWLAIESIRDKIFSTQSDIWSYGIVLWELFSLAKTPYPGMVADENLYLKLVDGYRMEKPDYANEEIYQIMRDCWNAKPTLRPSFSVLEQRVGAFLEENTRNHYLELNDPYMEMNRVWMAEKGDQNDYLDMMCSPDYGNVVTPSVREYVNMPLSNMNPAPPESFDQDGYLCMSPSKDQVIFSPRSKDVPVFDFSTSPSRYKGALSERPTSINEHELQPMLTIHNGDNKANDFDNDPKNPSWDEVQINPLYDSSNTNRRLQDELDSITVHKDDRKNGVSKDKLDAFTNPTYDSFKPGLFKPVNQYINVPNKVAEERV